MDDKWEGPFEVVRKIGEVHYEVLVNEGMKRRRIVHVNNREEWKEIGSAVLKVVVADEVELDKVKLVVSKLTEEQL